MIVIHLDTSQAAAKFKLLFNKPVFSKHIKPSLIFAGKARYR